MFRFLNLSGISFLTVLAFVPVAFAQNTLTLDSFKQIKPAEVDNPSQQKLEVSLGAGIVNYTFTDTGATLPHRHRGIRLCRLAGRQDAVPGGVRGACSDAGGDETVGREVADQIS